MMSTYYRGFIKIEFSRHIKSNEGFGERRPRLPLHHESSIRSRHPLEEICGARRIRKSLLWDFLGRHSIRCELRKNLRVEFAPTELENPEDFGFETLRGVCRPAKFGKIEAEENSKWRNL